MQKLSNFYKKYSVPIMIIVGLLLLLIIAFLVGKIIVNINKKNELKFETNEYYTYFTDQKLEFKAKVGFNKDGIIEAFDTDDLNKDSFIYADGKVIIPKNYAIIFYKQKGKTNRLNKFSMLTKNGEYILLNKENLASFFLTDGENNYFIPKEFTIKINGNEEKISGFSYVRFLNNKAYVYDYEKDTLLTFDSVKTLSIKVDDVKINLMDKTYILDSNLRMITSNINDLSVYERNSK